MQAGRLACVSVWRHAAVAKRVFTGGGAEPATTSVNGVVCLPSGSTLLDLVLGGGWAIGRVANLVGDKSTGKTLLAIEACANFARRHSAGNIRYAEVEAAFDQAYAQTMGMPKGIDYTEEVHTVEEFERDFTKWLDDVKGPNMYVLDSLDACSSEAEMDRDVGAATFGGEKAKALSTMFRKCAKHARDKECFLLVISQLRDNIGVRFGETKKRSGGHALDFYASQVIWLAQTKRVEKTVKGAKRVVGVDILAQNKKNKIGVPFRRAGMTLMFGYGTDDEMSMLAWLDENKAKVGDSSTDSLRKEVLEARAIQDRKAAASLNAEIKTAVKAHWYAIEDALKPVMSKYG